VISITDGQIFLDVDLFNAGVRPAINSGLSVSRVGGAAQTKIMKKLGGGTRLALAQFRELEAFSQFASDLDDATRKQLERGQRITELMKQKQYAPFSVADMALSLFVVEKGYLDDVSISEINPFEAGLRDFMHHSHAALIQRINETGAYDDEMESQLRAAVEEYKRTGSW
jgi:F-type H+-transporting ATPase subunit alpha